MLLSPLPLLWVTLGLLWAVSAPLYRDLTRKPSAELRETHQHRRVGGALLRAICVTILALSSRHTLHSRVWPYRPPLSPSVTALSPPSSLSAPLHARRRPALLALPLAAWNQALSRARLPQARSSAKSAAAATIRVEDALEPLHSSHTGTSSSP
jgi:hypothetical protein